MSKLNPFAGEFVPSFTAAPAAAAAPPSTASADVGEPAPAVVEAPPVTLEALERELSEVDAPLFDCLCYSIDQLLQFQPMGDCVPCRFPDVVRAPPPPKLGRVLNGRLVYGIPELLLFQPLYHTLPVQIDCAEILASAAAPTDKKAKKSKKDKAKKGDQMLQYDPALMCYFNPTEYAASLTSAGYGGVAADDSTLLVPGEPDHHNPNGIGLVDVEPINPVEEAIAAKRRLARILDDLSSDTVDAVLASIADVPVSCTHTLQEAIGVLFDRAIAAPAQSDAFAQLCSGLSERSPEFKEGAKTINFRRILLTKCYEALVEEPESSHPAGDAYGASNVNGTAQHSWRRQCMLHNVAFIGELFRRQLLTENIMHVCAAMMLEDEVNPQGEVVEAACRLLLLVGDLLDGSSPASRRTMDEYFAVLHRMVEHAQLPQHVRDLVSDMTTVRASGWVKKLAAAATANANANANANGKDESSALQTDQPPQS